MTPLPLVYIAGPFRGATPYDVKCNVHEAEALGLEVARCGGYPVIPHTMTQSFDKQLTDDFWLQGTLALLHVCHGIALTKRWQSSTGARAEHDDAERRGLPIFYETESFWRLHLADWIERWQSLMVLRA